MKITIELREIEKNDIKKAIKLALEAGKIDIEGNYYSYQDNLFEALWYLSHFLKDNHLLKLPFIDFDEKENFINMAINEVEKVGGICHTSDIVEAIGNYKDCDFPVDKRSIEYKNLFKVARIVDRFYNLGVVYYNNDTYYLKEKDIENVKKIENFEVF